ncbi:MULTISPECIES: GNAT family N-acetyltransferase [unclassified Bacillus (in: firmicutes)]|uniref:GNAT family N-acetyltransferase n=1 Tax=unclassified Bacillus (in: firmicutes) TaxID=185979 RepID=UPI0008E08B21|nr:MULTISPECIES: GNAT family N-acetyltransferase [unclassified Bacillus (in: firmicutes)]SFB06700.1 phosphinothricin acetyltransferase [Bacillus sp. UNCCL13]SFQ87605.1 phosphinothricin acetyltransferase [Bacillus sp. cl95]
MIRIREAVITDLPTMLKIYNYAILNLNATFDLVEQTLEERTSWFNKYGGKRPLIVAELEGEVVGYSCLSMFREKAAYDGTVEISVYLSPEHQGKGIGKSLMTEILKRAREIGYHAIIAGITTGNDSSVKLHEKFGFEFVGRFKDVGFKFDQWQSVDFYQLILHDE